MTEQNKQKMLDMYHAACQANGSTPREFTGLSKDEVAYIMIKEIIKARNQGWKPTEGATVWFPRLWWFSQEYIDKRMDEEDKKKLLPYKDVPMLRGLANFGSSAGLGFLLSRHGPAYAYAAVGAVLACKDEETALSVANECHELLIDFYEYPEE